MISTLLPVAGADVSVALIVIGPRSLAVTEPLLSTFAKLGLLEV